MKESVASVVLQPKSEKLAGVQTIWRALAGDAIGPKREDVTPAQLRSLLPWTFLIDAVGDDFKFRFAGDRIIQYMDSRLQGTLLSERRGTPYYDGMHRFFGRCVAGRAPLLTGPSRSTYPGKEHLEVEVLVLPLSDDGKTVSGLLGAFDTWRAGTHS